MHTLNEWKLKAIPEGLYTPHIILQKQYYFD